VLIDEHSPVYELIDSLLSGREHTTESLRQCLIPSRSIYADRSRITKAGGLCSHITHAVLKAPNATYEFERFRSSWHPRMHFVFLSRDARDVVCSMGRLQHIPMVANQLRLIARHSDLMAKWDREITLLESGETPEHIKRALIWKLKTGLFEEFIKQPLDALAVRYEEFVRSPELWKRQVMEHVELEVVTGSALDHETVMRGMGPGGTVRRRKVDQHSVNQWMQQLSHSEERDIWEVTGELMTRLGYRRQP